MIDKKRVDEVYRLMKDAGLKAFCIMGIDQDQNFLTLDGNRKDLVQMFANAVDDEDLRQVIRDGVKINLAANMLKGGDE